MDNSGVGIDDCLVLFNGCFEREWFYGIKFFYDDVKFRVICGYGCENNLYGK